MRVIRVGMQFLRSQLKLGYNEQTPMRNYFFEKGEPIKYAQGSFTLATHKLDMCPYALERIEDPPAHYVTNFYSSFDHPNFLHYLTCWDEVEEVKVKKGVDKKATLVGKKKAINLQSFLSRKKIQMVENGTQKGVVGSKKDVKEEPVEKQEFRQVNVIYVQLDGFKNIEFPKEIAKIKNTMAIVYLLGLEVFNDLGFWPSMIPVLNLEKAFKFVKKGKSRNEQITGLYETMMAKIEPSKWSPEMESIYEMYEINGDSNLLTEKVIADLQAIIYSEYQMNCIIDGKEVKEKIKVVRPRVIQLVNSGYQLPLEEFIITFAYKDENTKEIILEHHIFEDLVLQCSPNHFIAQYFKHIRAY